MSQRSEKNSRRILREQRRERARQVKTARLMIDGKVPTSKDKAISLASYIFTVMCVVVAGYFSYVMFRKSIVSSTSSGIGGYVLAFALGVFALGAVYFTVKTARDTWNTVRGKPMR